MSNRDENMPQILRERLARQRRRARLLRYSLAVSFAAALVLTLVYGQWQLAAPASRTVLLHRDGSTLWMVDQSLRVSGQAVVRGAGIRLLALKDGSLATGPAFDGAAGGIATLGDNRLGITTDNRLLVFDTATEGWPRLEVRSLGLNDSAANPVVAAAAGQPWLCWVRGPEILVQPLGTPEAEPQLLFKTRTSGSRLHAIGQQDTIWLAVREIRSGAVTVLAFRPRLEKPADGPPRTVVALEAPVPAMATGQVSFAVLSEAGRPGVPVLAYTRKEDTSGRWQVAVYTRKEGGTEGQWQDVDGPPREARPSTMNPLNFLSLAGQGATLTAIYSDGARVMRAEATGIAAPAWGEATELELTSSGSLAGTLAWAGVLLALWAVVTAQLVWLLLNRERPADRALSELLERAAPQEKKKEPPLLHASGLVRALALLLDLGLTSPVVILLRSVYKYEWEEAYGFLAVGTLLPVDSSIMQIIGASLVTLAVLSIYATFCEVIWGRTFGKALFRLRVVDAEGEAPHPWRIAVRNLVRVVEMLHWVILFIPMGLMMLSGKQQRLGDLLAGTYVVVDLVPEESPDDSEL